MMGCVFFASPRRGFRTARVPVCSKWSRFSRQQNCEYLSTRSNTSSELIPFQELANPPWELLFLNLEVMGLSGMWNLRLKTLQAGGKKRKQAP